MPLEEYKGEVTPIKQELTPYTGEVTPVKEPDFVQQGLEKLPGVLRPIAETGVGLAENVANMTVGYGAIGVGGLAGLGSLAVGRGPEKSAETMHNVTSGIENFLQSAPVTDIGKRGNENIQHAYNTFRNWVGEKTDFGPISRTAGEFSVDFLTNVLPLMHQLKTTRANIRANADLTDRTKAFETIDQKVKAYEADLKAIHEEQKVPSTIYVDRQGTAMGELPDAYWQQRADTLSQEARTRQAGETPMEPPAQETFQKGLELTQEGAASGGPPTITWGMGEGRVPSVNMKGEWTLQPKEEPTPVTPDVPKGDPAIIRNRSENYYRAAEEAFKNGEKEKGLELAKKADEIGKQADDIEAAQRQAKKSKPIPIDPLQRATAIDLLSDPRYRGDVTRLQNIYDKIAKKTAEYNDPIVQRGLDMNEAIGLNKARTIGQDLEALHQQRIRTEARVLAATDWATEMATRRGATIEKTPGWDGPQHSIKVSFWDRLSSGMSRALDRGFTPTSARRRQSGTISVDLLTLGIPTLIKNIGESATLKKFVGTFRKITLANAINRHLTGESIKRGSAFGELYGTKGKLGWITPQQFLEMANKIEPEQLKSPESWGSQAKIRDISNALENRGLDEIPILSVANPHWVDGYLAVDTMVHDGRHRMTKMNQLGMKQVPVEWIADNETHAAIQSAIDAGKPVRILSQDGKAVMDFPGFMKLDPAEFGRKPPSSQAGMADRRLLEAIGTAGISELVRGGISLAAKVREGLNKSKLQQQTPKTADPSPQGILDAASGETRTPEQWKADQPDLTKIKDVDGIVTQGVGKWVNANFFHQFSDNPLVKYIGDKINNNIRLGHLEAKLTKDGSVGHHPVEDSPTARLNALTGKDKALLNEVADRYAGRYELSGEELRTLGASERVVDAYRVLRKAFDDMFDKVNSVRSEPMNKLPGYLARIREGDFKLDVVDKNGTKVWSDLFKSKVSRAMAERGLREKFGDEYKYESSMLDNDTRGNPYNTTTIPFEELMRTIEKNDPRRSAIESVARNIAARRGFGRHAIKREHIAGREFDVAKGFEQFTDSAFNYIANMKNKQFVREINFDPDINAPKIKEWANTYNELASGGFKPGEIIDSLSDFGEKVWTEGSLGFSGPSGFRNAIRTANNLFMAKVLFLWRPWFAGIQLMQPFQFIPQHLSHMKNMGFDSGIVASMYKGNKSLVELTAGKVDPEFRSFIKDYMEPRGGIDPSMIQAMNFIGNKFGSGTTLGKVKDWVLGTPPLKLIEAFGRYEAAAAGYHFLKDAGLEGKQLFIETENFVNRVMVDYSKQERPGIIGKSGIIGTIAGPLTTFATNFWTSTALFLHDITKNPTKIQSYEPMAIHIAQTAIWGGLTGTLGVGIADKLIEILRHPRIGLLNPKFKTVSERIMTNSNIPDMVTFGIPSAATGQNISGSFAAPEMNIPSMNTIPGIALTTQIIESLWPLVTGSDTKVNRQQFFKTVMPNSLVGLLDLYDVDAHLFPPSLEATKRQSGEMVPDINHRGQGSFRLTPEEITARKFGVHTLDTTRELAASRNIQTREPDINTAKGMLVDKAVDIAMEGGKGDIGDLMRQGVELGMTPKQFMDNMKESIKQRELTKLEKAHGLKPNTLSRIQKLQETQQYQR